MKQLTSILILSAFLTACGGGDNYSNDNYALEEYEAVPAPVTVTARRLDQGYSDGAAPVAPAPGADPIPNEDGAAQFIAYSYSLGLELSLIHI